MPDDLVSQPHKPGSQVRLPAEPSWHRHSDQNVVGTELDFIIVLAGMQGIEIGNAIDAQGDGFASSTNCFCPILWAASGHQPDKVAVALQPEPISIPFHFVKPVRAGRVAGWPCGQAELEGLKHARKDYPRTAPVWGHRGRQTSWGRFSSPDGGLILGVWGVRNNVGLPGVNCQSYPPRQLTYALKKAAKQNGSGA
jgi:hypothetical protein